MGMLFDEPRKITGSGGAALATQQGVAQSQAGEEQAGQKPEPAEPEEQQASVPSVQPVSEPK